MATTLKLKKNPTAAPDKSKPSRPPVRGAGSGLRHRPTLAEAQTQRAERDALKRQEQQEQRRESKSPQPSRDARPPARAGSPSKAFQPPRRDDGAPQRPRTANTAFGRASEKTAEPAGAFRTSPPASTFDARGRGDSPRRPAARPAPSPSAPAPHRAKKAAIAVGTGSPALGQPAPEHAPGSVRLSKRMSELGLASRREADEWIEKGWVRVDGEVVRELGSRVLPDQAVTIDSQARQQQARQVTVLLNKPIGFVSGQAEDGYEPAFVLVTPQNQWREDGSGIRFHRDHLRSLVPAGRLDIDSTGLLVLTQDGRAAKALIGEDSPVDKEYLVRVQSLDGQLPAQQALSARQLAQLNHGLELDGQPLRPAKVEWVNEDQLRFVLVEGKKRQIRRMCEAVGLKVTGLKRVRIGRVMLGDLPVGQWRYLRGDEAF